MKIVVDENCLAANASLLTLEEYQEPFQYSDWAHFLPEGRNPGDAQFQNEIQEIIQNSFINSNKFYLHGALACIYFITGLITFLTGLATFFQQADASQVSADSTPNTLDVNTIVFPIIVMIYDCDVRRVYRKRELYWILGFKLLAFVFYYLIMGLVYSGSNNEK